MILSPNSFADATVFNKLHQFIFAVDSEYILSVDVGILDVVLGLTRVHGSRCVKVVLVHIDKLILIAFLFFWQLLFQFQQYLFVLFLFYVKIFLFKNIVELMVNLFVRFPEASKYLVIYLGNPRNCLGSLSNALLRLRIDFG